MAPQIKVIKGKVYHQIFNPDKGFPFTIQNTQVYGELIFNKLSDSAPETVLNYLIQHNGHPLYNELEWNDKKCGHTHRLDQIRRITNHINQEWIIQQHLTPKQVIVNVPAPIKGQRPAGVSVVVSTNPTKREYISEDKILITPLYLSQAEKQGMDILSNFCWKYKIYDKFKTIIDDLTNKHKVVPKYM